MQLHLVDADAQCALTARIDGATSMETVAAAASSLLPREAAQAGSEPGTLLWAANDQNGTKIGVGLKVSNQSGMNLATFNVQKLGQTQ